MEVGLSWDSTAYGAVRWLASCASSRALTAGVRFRPVIGTPPSLIHCRNASAHRSRASSTPHRSAYAATVLSGVLVNVLPFSKWLSVLTSIGLPFSPRTCQGVSDPAIFLLLRRSLRLSPSHKLYGRCGFSSSPGICWASRAVFLAVLLPSRPVPNTLI